MKARACRKYTLPFLLLGYFLTFLGCEPRITNQHSRNQTIICFGDSITEGVGAGLGEDYPSLLSQKLGLPVINAGRSGDTTLDALKRLKEDVLGKDPKLVIVEFGANDFFKRIPQNETFSNLDKIVEEIQRQGAMVALVTVRIGLFVDEYGSGYRKIASKRGTLWILRVMDDVLENPQLKSDGLHPNSQGYAIIADRIFKQISPFIK